MKKLYALTFALLLLNEALGQTVDLTFTAIDSGAYIQLDSIRIMNRTQGGSTVLIWPDTTLTYDITPGDTLLYIGYVTVYPVGVQTVNNEISQFQLFQSYPNPVRDQAVISMSLPSRGPLNIKIADIRGRLALTYDRELKEGTHSFIFHPGDERVYILTAQWNGITQSIKILTEGLNNGKTCRLEYTGIERGNPELKQTLVTTDLTVEESGILDFPDSNETYTFQFATNIPCLGTPTVEYEGQVYNTIQIFSQCWLKENLNVGTMIPGKQGMSNDSVIEKHCYNNEVDSCTKYGGLYQWNEMMQYTTQQGAQGICPPGWHLPTDEEWKVLEGAADSQYGIGDEIWDSVYNHRGFDAGTNLKTTSGWYDNGNGADLFGFSGLPGGYRSFNGYFYNFSFIGKWWTSSEYDDLHAWYRNLGFYLPEVTRSYYSKIYGSSVRCLRDY